MAYHHPAGSRYHRAAVKDTDIARIQSTLQRHSGLELALVFGSVARGTARDDSDLDIGVQAARLLSARQKMDLIGDLAEALGRPVDLIDLRTVGEPLLGQILTHGHRVLGSADAHGRLLSRHLLDAADFLPYAQRIIDERRRAWIGK
jgi:predicted nucleotidyltransferase